MASRAQGGGSVALRSFMTSQQAVGSVVRTGAPETPRAASYLNHENVLGSVGFALPRVDAEFAPTFEVTTVPHPQTGLPEHWLAVQFASKYDGDGMARHGRPALAVSLVLDISGSMQCTLEGDEEGGRRVSKLESAKACVGAILEQLGPRDSVSVLLFNHDTHVLQAAAAATAALKKKILSALAKVGPGGTTQLEKGFKSGMDALAAAAKAAPGAHALRRVYFLTDMQSSQQDEDAVLAEAAKRAAQVKLPPLHTTVVGMGVDLSVGTVERLSSIGGGKYLSVSNTKDFEESVGSDFSHDVTPIAHGITLETAGGWAFERACGSAELNSMAPGATKVTLSSEFASPLDDKGEAMGAVLLLKLRPPADGSGVAAASVGRRARSRLASVASALGLGDGGGGGGGVALHCSWTGTDGRCASAAATLAVPPLGAPLPSVSRKALSLSRFCDLQAAFCDASDGDELETRLQRLQQCRDGRARLLSDMDAVGDDSLHGRNANLLQTLDQIIELEARETAEMQAALDRAAAAAANATAVGKRTRGAAAAAAASAPRGRKQARTAQPPERFLCPVTKELMTDPVCTADGHSFERTAIVTWLASHSTSPLTGLRLEHKKLAPNHALRALIKEWQEGA